MCSACIENKCKVTKFLLTLFWEDMHRLKLIHLKTSVCNLTVCSAILYSVFMNHKRHWDRSDKFLSHMEAIVLISLAHLIFTLLVYLSQVKLNISQLSKASNGSHFWLSEQDLVKNQYSSWTNVDFFLLSTLFQTWVFPKSKVEKPCSRNTFFLPLI